MCPFRNEYSRVDEVDDINTLDDIVQSIEHAKRSSSYAKAITGNKDSKKNIYFQIINLHSNLSKEKDYITFEDEIKIIRILDTIPKSVMFYTSYDTLCYVLGFCAKYKFDRVFAHMYSRYCDFYSVLDIDIMDMYSLDYIKKRPFLNDFLKFSSDSKKSNYFELSIGVVLVMLCVNFTNYFLNYYFQNSKELLLEQITVIITIICIVICCVVGFGYIYYGRISHKKYCCTDITKNFYGEARGQYTKYMSYKGINEVLDKDTDTIGNEPNFSFNPLYDLNIKNFEESCILNKILFSQFIKISNNSSTLYALQYLESNLLNITQSISERSMWNVHHSVGYINYRYVLNIFLIQLINYANSDLPVTDKANQRAIIDIIPNVFKIVKKYNKKYNKKYILSKDYFFLLDSLITLSSKEQQAVSIRALIALIIFNTKSSVSDKLANLQYVLTKLNNIGEDGNSIVELRKFFLLKYKISRIYMFIYSTMLFFVFCCMPAIICMWVMYGWHSIFESIPLLCAVIIFGFFLVLVLFILFIVTKFSSIRLQSLIDSEILPSCEDQTICHFSRNPEQPDYSTDLVGDIGASCDDDESQKKESSSKSDVVEKDCSSDTDILVDVTDDFAVDFALNLETFIMQD